MWMSGMHSALYCSFCTHPWLLLMTTSLAILKGKGGSPCTSPLSCSPPRGMRARIMVLGFFAWSPVWVSGFQAWPYETKQSQLGSCLGFLCCLDAYRSSVSAFIVCKSSWHSKRRIESLTVVRSGVSAHSKALLLFVIGQSAPSLQTILKQKSVGKGAKPQKCLGALK